MSARSVVLLIALATLATSLAVPTHAVPAAPKIHILKQPDGTTLQARLRGDEWLNWWETLEGRVIARDPQTGWWGRSVKPSARRYPPMPLGGDRTNRMKAATGDWEVPVICINFTDTSTTFTPAQFQTALFAGTGKTMRTFYNENSYGSFLVNQGPSGVAGWYTAANDHDYYGYWGGTNWGASQELVEEAVQAADAAGFNFGSYDNDGDGYIDSVCLVHQGGGTEATGDDSDIWSHRWSINPLTTSSGKIVYDYIMNPEMLGSNMSTIGVFCHEYGHALDLPDLYDYDYDSNGVGSWSLMAGGSWNAAAA